MTTEAVLSGISLGFVLALLIGPVFFLLVDTGIHRGFRAAVFIAAGVVASDALFVVIAYFSSTAIRFIQTNQTIIGTAGGLILIIFGLITFFRKPVISGEQLMIEAGKEWKGAGKGFVMNFLNPFVLLFWIGVAGTLPAPGKASPFYAVEFFLAALGTVFATDLLKAWGAARLKKLIKPGFLVWLNRISGTGLVLFGFRLLAKLL